MGVLNRKGASKDDLGKLTMNYDDIKSTQAQRNRMFIKAFVLKQVTAWLLGGDVFNSIKNIVSELMKEDKTGKEKREAAIRRVNALGINIADFLVNLGIEVAVMYLRTKKEDN